jgi:hypothetical protein
VRIVALYQAHQAAAEEGGRTGVMSHDVEYDLGRPGTVDSEPVVAGEDQREAGGVRCPPIVALAQIP